MDLPYGIYGRVLKHVSSVQVKENASDHDHLLAMRFPAMIHSFKTQLFIHVFLEKFFDIFLDVLFG